MPTPNNPAELQPTAAILERYYTALLGPFEEAYRRNMMEQSQRAALAAGRMPPGTSQGQMNPQARPGGMPGMPGQTQMPATMNMMPQANAGPSLDSSLPGQFHPVQALQAPPFQLINPMVAGNMMSNNGAPIPGMNMNGTGMKIPPVAVPNGAGELDHDSESRKRKMQEAVESEAKRARQKTGPSGGSDVSDSRSSVAPPPSVDGSVAPTVTRTIRQPSRRKIEYVPFAREIDTAGGRDLDAIQNEWHRTAAKPVRHIDEWGQVDIDALTLSLRSRVSTEVSYALTTFTLLTLLRAPEQGRGFPIVQAPDLFDEMVDLIEDLAFEGVEDEGYAPGDDDAPIATHRELVNVVVEDGSKPFAALERKQGARDPAHGPRHRPAEVILAVVNIIRNLSLATENQEYLAKHPKLLHVLLRLCALVRSTTDAAPRPPRRCSRSATSSAYARTS
ncbi:hypothetical protein BN946_scf184977.g45 [Trametes cinnabarina]|uniref:SWI/SNF-like complex subunit BAF250 C-terminal domain-containing protein n=1 Tax=Pycnoporus cinnabarinus TaxID=5643 RepID=A0A060SIV2_PYCCI|nr:hypothetical protein BN946_scf184977.g45 [Trametes cinnabarina]